MPEKLTEAQYSALKWANSPQAVHWAGKAMGSPSRAAVNALLRRGLLSRVGQRVMELHTITPAGRLALANQGGGRIDG